MNTRNTPNHPDAIIANLVGAISTRLRDHVIIRVYTAFKDQPVTQQGLGAVFHLSRPYISRLLRQRGADTSRMGGIEGEERDREGEEEA